MNPIKLKIDWSYMIDNPTRDEYTEIQFKDEWIEPIPEDEVDEWYETDEDEREDNIRFWLEGYCGTRVTKVKEIRPVDAHKIIVIADITMFVSKERDEYYPENDRAYLILDDMHIEVLGNIIFDELDYFIIEAIWEKYAHVSIQKIDEV